MTNPHWCSRAHKHPARRRKDSFGIHSNPPFDGTSRPVWTDDLKKVQMNFYDVPPPRPLSRVHILFRRIPQIRWAISLHDLGHDARPTHWRFETDPENLIPIHKPRSNPPPVERSNAHETNHSKTPADRLEKRPPWMAGRSHDPNRARRWSY